MRTSSSHGVATRIGDSDCLLKTQDTAKL